MKLQEALETCTLSLLRRVCSVHQLPIEEEALRAELASRLHRRLVDADYLIGCMGSLSGAEREVLQAVRRYGWIAKAFVLERQFPGPRKRSSQSYQTNEGPNLSLLHKGLLFRAFGPVGDWQGEIYYVPEELHLPMSRALPPSSETEQARIPEVQVPGLIWERDAAFDAFCLLSFLRREQCKLTQGTLSRADLSKLEKETSFSRDETEPSRLEEHWRFLLHLCLAGGWVQKRGPFLMPRRSAFRLLSGEPPEVDSRLQDRYLKDRNWSDLEKAGRVRQLLGGRPIDESAARRLLVHYLEELTCRKWTPEEAFITVLRSTSPDFLREDYSSPAQAVFESATGAELYGTTSWDTVEGEWIRYVIRGPLQWLGIVRTGSDGNGMAFQFRRPAHEGVLAPPRANTNHRPRIQIGEGLELIAPSEVDLGKLYLLEQYLELRSRGKPSSYRLTRESVVAALEKGGSWRELRELLGTLLAEPLPSSAATRLKEWTSTYGRFELVPGPILSAKNPEDAAVLEGIPNLQVHLAESIGPGSYRVAADRVGDLVQLLRQAGYPPRVDSAATAEGVRSATFQRSVLRECLFALQLLGSLGPEMQLEDRAAAVGRLEAVLGQVEADEIALRAGEMAGRRAAANALSSGSDNGNSPGRVAS